MSPVTNVGEQGHEFTGAPGKVDRLLATEGREDPEGAFFVIAPAPGGRLWFTNEFEAGTNGVFCFFPDVESGKPHVELGMKSEFTAV